MKVTNSSTVKIRIAGYWLDPRETIEIPEHHWQGWLLASSANQRVANDSLLVNGASLGPSAEDASPRPAVAPTPQVEPRKPEPGESETKPAPPETPAAPEWIDPAKVDAALSGLDQADEKLWTEAGLPQIPALQKVTGYKQLRARDRDASVLRTNIRRRL